MTNTIRIDGIKHNVHDDDTAALARRIYEDRKAGRPTPLLECTDKHRGEMFLQERFSSRYGMRLWAIHKPGQGGPGCSTRIGNEGPGHQAAKDYFVRAMESHGYQTETEYSTAVDAEDRNATRLDAAVVNGPVKLGFEAQFSPLKPEAARGRTTKSYNRGWMPIWQPGSNDMPLARYHSIPMVRPHTDIAWAEGLPKPYTVVVPSKRPFVMALCRDAFDRCPDTGRGVCSKYHPSFPAPEDGFDPLDEVWGELAGGLTVPLMDAKGVVRLVTAEDYRRYEEATGLSGEYRAASTKPEVLVQTKPVAVPCVSERLIAPPVVVEAKVATTKVERTPLTIPRRTATFSPATPDFFTQEPCWALQFGGYYPLLVVLLKATVPAHARDWDATTKTWFIHASHVDALDTALRAHNCAVRGLTAPVISRPPIPVRDVWSAAAERDRQFGEANRARIRNMRLDANGFVIQNGGVA